MDPVQLEVYSIVLTSAPYVIAAYALMLVVLFVYIFFAQQGLKKAKKQMAVLQETVDRLEQKQG